MLILIKIGYIASTWILAGLLTFVLGNLHAHYNCQSKMSFWRSLFFGYFGLGVTFIFILLYRNPSRHNSIWD